MSWKILVSAVLAAVVLIVIAQNVDQVGVRVLFWEMRMPLFFLLVVCAAISFGVGYLVARISARRKRGREPNGSVDSGNTE